MNSLLDGCEIYSPSLEILGVGTNKCIKCESTSYISVVELSDQVILVSPNLDNTLMNNNNIKLDNFPPIKCVTKHTSNGLPGENSYTLNLVDYCKYYTYFEDGRLTCLRCQNRYTGNVSPTGAISSGTVYEKAADEEYENIPARILKPYSFLKCIDENEIPFLYLQEENYGNLSNKTLANSFMFGLFNVDQRGNIYNQVDKKVKNLECLPFDIVYKSNFRSSYDSSNLSILNCALA